MKTRLVVVLFVSFFVMFSCRGLLLNKDPSVVNSNGKQEKPPQGFNVNSENYLGYQPIDPIPVSKVKIFDTGANNEKEVFLAVFT